MKLLCVCLLVVTLQYFGDAGGCVHRSNIRYTKCTVCPQDQQFEGAWSKSGDMNVDLLVWYFQNEDFSAYHSALHVGDELYNFGENFETVIASGGCVSDPSSSCDSRYQWKFHGRYNLGLTSKTQKEVDAIVESLSCDFTEDTYDLLNNNCNTFTSSLAEKLGFLVSYNGKKTMVWEWINIFRAPEERSNTQIYGCNTQI